MKGGIGFAVLVAIATVATVSAQGTAPAKPVATPVTAPVAPAAPATAKDAWVDLKAAAAAWKATVSYDPLTGVGSILRGRDLVRFKKGLSVYAVGTGAALSAQAIRDGGARLEIPQASVAALSAWFAAMDAERASRFTIAAILIDPGHGGKDSGAIGEFGAGKDKLRILEKDVALGIGADVYARLRALWPDKQILITRVGDTYPTLDDRVDMANDAVLGVNEAIIYVSIHANASFNKSASGFEVWYLNPDIRRTVVGADASKGIDQQVLPIWNSMLEEEYTTESVLLAQNIIGGLKSSVGSVMANRGLREEEWFVVKNAKMPSVLIEVGFVTNEAEARLLSDPDHLRKLGDGIYNGIVDFVDYFEHRKGPDSP